MRYFITLSYDGTNYHGWQIQPNGVSVQETVQKALSTLLRQPMEIVGAGRTDAGVHASMMVAHFDWNPLSSADGDGKLDCAQLVYKLNKILPPDIAIQKVEMVDDDMHARFSATSRTYHYFVHLQKDPFERAYSWRLPYKVDVSMMNEAAKLLLGEHDFTSFSKTNTDTKTNICTVTHALWTPVSISQQRTSDDVGAYMFTITANRFLRNMVRAVVGTLLEIGRGKMSIEEFQKVIEQKDRCKAGESVPGNALFLVDIKY